MSSASHHAEWLQLVPHTGPFLSLPVLQRIFPQELEALETGLRGHTRDALEDWREQPGNPAIHRAWILHVLQGVLRYAEEVLAEGQSIPPGLEARQLEHGEVLRPDFVLVNPAGHSEPRKPRLLICVHPSGTNLDKPLADRRWKASPASRMAELCHAANVPLGLVTNGDHWMLVWAPRGETTGYASWFAHLWSEEPLTFRAFISLLRASRFFAVALADTLAGLYAESARDQSEVTDQLGLQVRQAVQVLIQSLDRLDAMHGRTLLADTSEKELYNAALTVMMRLVFLFCAEEKGLLLLGNHLYDENYAVSTLREILREAADRHGEELLESRHDAWCRLLATFRAIHSGIEHDELRLPAYGGGLFDPNRYPFLEGRPAKTDWQNTPARPLEINNRVVLHLLEALQTLETRLPGTSERHRLRLSFRALDIEQIGHVYEGLLDHTAKRARDPVLGVVGKKGAEPELPLGELENEFAKGQDIFLAYLAEATGKEQRSLGKLLDSGSTGEAPPQLKDVADGGRKRRRSQAVPTVDAGKLRIACENDETLIARVTPFAALLREDTFGRPLVYPGGSLYVTSGSDRRSTGTHYTPRSLTEPIVQHTLEPLVYFGPAEGKPREEWKLKSAKELLALKVCDMAMGSGAFLVQTCRYLAERLVEAWEQAEKAQPGAFITTPEGELSTGAVSERLLPADSAERLSVARRYVADRCLYGVDINPMAVEMAKLSLWLITLQRDRPFTFLDHALKCGDSLLGVSSVQQIENFSLRPGERQVTFATANLFRYVDEASAKRRALEDLPSNDHTQIETKNRLHAEAEAATAKVKAVADCLIAFELRGLDGDAYEDQRTAEAEKVQLLMKRDADASLKSQKPTINQLSAHAREQLRARRAFHWPVEFPEVFARGGFDAFVGNPPFMGGHKITGELGTDYRNYLVEQLASGQRGSADFCAYFFLRAFTHLKPTQGLAGLIATNSIAQGETREVGLEQIVTGGGVIPRAVPSRPWPGVAALEVAHVWLRRGPWTGAWLLDERIVSGITPMLTEPGQAKGKPLPLAANIGKSFKGSDLMGAGFIISKQTAEALIQQDGRNRDVVFPFINGEDLHSTPDQSPTRAVICFFDWPLDRQSENAERVAADYPGPLEILRRDVYPYRTSKKADGTFALRRPLPQKWWIFNCARAELYKTISPLEAVLVKAEVTDAHAFVRMRPEFIFSLTLYVFAFPEPGAFTVLQSSFHEAWARTLGSSLETRFRYTPSSCFETFPFPLVLTGLDDIGSRYHELRREIMQTRQEGLTKTYNRFHDRGEQSADIARLRVLHVEMDQAVAAAYGWGDLDLGHGFHPTKQGERYTLSEPASRTVLDRLLALNHQRYAEEVKAGLHEKNAKKPKTPRKPKVGAAVQESRELTLDFGQAPAKPNLDAAATAIVLIPYLLSEAARAKISLRMTELKRAFDFITNPSLMKSSAKPADRMALETWIGSWQSPAGPEWFIKTLRQLSGGTVRATSDEDDPPMALVVTPTHPESPELREGIRLAVHIARDADPLPPEERTAILRERRSIFTTA